MEEHAGDVVPGLEHSNFSVFDEPFWTLPMTDFRLLITSVQSLHPFGTGLWPCALLTI